MPENNGAAEVSLSYSKTDGAKKVTIVISANEPLSMIDVVRTLSSVVTQILMTGKY